jgi:hypothetical protein
MVSDTAVVGTCNALPMRVVALGMVVAVGTACGAASSMHYDRTMAMECLRQTSSMAPVAEPDRILLLFAGSPVPDGAAEGVVIGFGDGPNVARARADSLNSTRIGRIVGTARHRAWEVERGDAYAAGTGAFESPVAKRRGIGSADVAKAVRELDASVQPAVEKCLEQNER